MPRILTTEEVTLLLEQPSGNTPKELRDKAMLELLYATGIRVSELISLKVSDLNLQMEYVICTDIHKERIIIHLQLTTLILKQNGHIVTMGYSPQTT